VRLWAGVALAEAADAVIAAASGGLSSSTFLQLAALVAGSGGLASYLTGRHRRKSGEARSAAAEDVAHGATEMAGAVKDLIQPLREENARLHGVIAALQARLVEKTEAHADTAVALAQCEAAYEKRRHKDASDLAALAVDIETARLELAVRDERIRTLEVLADQAPDRRDGERRNDQP
jgi:hypothetical protein